MKFLLVRTIEDETSAARIAVLERLASELAWQSAEQKSAFETDKAQRASEHANKARRWQEAIALAEPIAVGEEIATTLQLGEGWRLEGALVAGGGVSCFSPPSERRATRPARTRKVTLQSVGELTILVQGRQTVRVDYQTTDGRSLSKVWEINQTLTLQKVSVPLTVTITLGNVRVSRELTTQNPTAVLNLGGVQ